MGSGVGRGGSSEKGRIISIQGYHTQRTLANHTVVLATAIASSAHPLELPVGYKLNNIPDSSFTIVTQSVQENSKGQRCSRSQHAPNMHAGEEEE